MFSRASDPVTWRGKYTMLRFGYCKRALLASSIPCLAKEPGFKFTRVQRDVKRGLGTFPSKDVNFIKEVFDRKDRT